jgi:hypothetical protein
MGIEERAEKAQSVISEQLSELREVINQSVPHDTEYGLERMRRWKRRTVCRLADDVHPTEADKLAKMEKTMYTGDPIANLVDEAKMYERFLVVLAEEIREHPEYILDAPVPASVPYVEIEVPTPKSSNAVFVIHGHDELNLLRLKEMLRERWNLEPIVMSGRPGKGRTLIEKFEDEAQSAVYAIALMTPDDVVSIDGGTYTQARPNVVFELGWFYGRLRRDRVCILFKEGTHIHSDLDGISRIEFTESVGEKFATIEDELIAAGILTR